MKPNKEEKPFSCDNKYTPHQITWPDMNLAAEASKHLG